MNTNPELQMNSEVMLRIKTVRQIRMVLASPFIGLAIMAILMMWAAIIISIHDVMHNIMIHQSFVDDISYIYSSLLHSRLIVQIIASLIALSSVYFIITSLRKIKVPKINFHFSKV